MKYMTKEWYETMQKSDMYLSLRVSKKAESFSEKYFKDLYKREEKKWLKIWEDVTEVEFEGIDLDEERKNFKRSFCENVNALKKKLPESILKKVADIRVLALEHASAEVKKEITEYCKKNEKSVEAAMNSYQKEYRKQFMSNAPSFLEDLDLHDCEVLSCRKKGNDIVLTIDNSGGFTNINKITIKNCSVIKQDAPLHGAWCLYEEVYKSGERYEIHFLLYKNKPIDFIVLADDLEYQYEE